MKIDKESKYQVIAVNLRKDGMVIAVAPYNSSHVYTGDMVELSNGKVGVAMISDDYVQGEDLPDIEAAAGEELLQVVGIFKKFECKWEDE